MKTGIELIAEERKKQIEVYEKTIDHDVEENDYYQLSDAASLLANHDIHDQDKRDIFYNNPPHGWGFDWWHKMYDKAYKERLIISGALIAAEIDRLQRIGE